MKHDEPGTIRDEELLAYLAGEKIRPEAQQHVLDCKYCSSRLEEYRRLQLSLESKLYRWDCPPNQLLGEYMLGLLSNELAAAVKTHLSNCVLCTVEIATITQFLNKRSEPVLTGIERYDIKGLLERSANLDSSIEQVEERAYLDNALATGKQREVFSHLFYKFLADAIETQLKQPVIPPYMRLDQEIVKAEAYQLLNSERARILQRYLSTDQTMSDIQRAEGFKSKSGVHKIIHSSLEMIWPHLPLDVQEKYISPKDAIKTKSAHHTESSKIRLRQGLDRLRRERIEKIEFSDTHKQNLSEAASRRWQRAREANKAALTEYQS